jgi:uncharacterized protein DUF1592/uncharacterized protein DUF1588/uncharacterized protein DUF1595/uncharacterized protein DUF1585
MRTFRHLSYIGGTTLLLASLAACGSSSGNGPDTPGGMNQATAGSGSTTNPNGTAGNGSVGTGGMGPDTSDASTCIPGIQPSSQIPRMKNAAYDNVMRDLLGITTLASAGAKPASTLLADDSDGSMTDIAWNGYQSAADKVAAEVMAGTNKAKFISCDPAMDSCLTDTIKSFGRKAFRRPVTDAEVTSFMRLNSLTPKGSPAEVAEAILYAILVSPSFIMLPELAQDKDASGALKLTSYEVASRLSFLLWGTTPDADLSAAADAGMLTTPEQISAQAQRLLTSPNAKAVVSSFHQFYAGIQNSSHWKNTTMHDAKFTAFTAASYAPLMAEIDAFFSDVVLNQGSFKDVFTSNTGFVTSDTAAIYGLNPSSYTKEPQKVMLDATQRPGFLTRAGFLSTFSHSDSSSPILRGAFISGRVLGINPGTPDPAALKTQVPVGTYTTNRQQVEALTGGDPCNSCHGKFINGSGFVLERFNSIGSWQDTDQLGGPIDSTGNVMLSPTNTKTISSPAELMAAIAVLPEAMRHYSEQWVAYASGRNPNSNDACTVEKLATNMGAGTYPISKMMADYTQSDSFRLRTVGN